MLNRILILFSICILYCNTASIAQTFGNEWIQYNQMYFKFQIDTDRVYRIPIADLQALGIPNNVLGDNLQLFRDGEEEPIYVSNNGILTGSDYIEFYGRRADGTLDSRLFKNVANHMNPSQNFLSDTAFYFITYNNSTSNKRFTPMANDLTNLPLKEEIFWDKIAKQYREAFNGGPSYQGQFNTPVSVLNSSQYERGEGFSRRVTTNKDSVVFTCLYPYKIAGGPVATLTSIVVGNSYLTNHRVKVFANSNEIADETYSQFDFKKIVSNVNMQWINAQNRFSFRYDPQNNGQLYPDRYGMVSVELRYPRIFNFNNVSSFYFELNPKGSDYYLEISNFNTGNVSPRLYDLTDNRYIMGDISQAGIVRFKIPASLNIKRLVLQSNGTPSYNPVSKLHKVNFKNYTQAAQQGDYIILSRNEYFDDGNGNNYLNEYKNYRSSLAGGSYQSIVVDLEDIYNEFGYGYFFSSMAVKNFLHYASRNNNWSPKPKHVFIVGKGIGYSKYISYRNIPYTNYPFYAVPTYGEPPSDNLLSDFDNNNKSNLSIGRLPIMNPIELRDYLEKVKDHESQINVMNMQYSDSILWRKKVLHIAGASDASQQTALLSALIPQASIISKPYWGANTYLVKKSTTGQVESANSAMVDELFNTGVSFIQFFGHSSSTTMDYNLDFPENYKNYRRYPVFMANGCSAGDMFILQGGKSLGERFVFAKNKGALAFIASVNTGYTNYLSRYTDSLYQNFTFTSYGKTLGEQISQNITAMMSNPVYANDGGQRTHCEQIGLNGDPATMLSYFSKPDYAIEEKGVTFKQLSLTTSLDTIDVDVIYHNLGRYTYDSVNILISRTLPNNITQVVVQEKYPALAISDTLRLRIPTYGNLGLGANSLEIALDYDLQIDEISESNNTIKRIFTIYNDDLVPVYPYDFSIVNTQGVILKSSTLNPFADKKKYLIQIDTTEHFDSPLLRTNQVESIGGVMAWQPNITLQDSTVYYWRTAMDTLYGNKFHRWSNSSFIFLSQAAPGWSQSHYYQLQKDYYNSIHIDSASRWLQFDGLNKKLQVQTVCLNGPSPYNYNFADYLVKINGSTLYTFGCPDNTLNQGNLQFVIIDTLTGAPYLNKLDPLTGQGTWGSIKPCRVDKVNFIDPFFEFRLATTADRNTIMAFLDSIPNGYYVMMRNRTCIGNCGVKNTRFIKDWMADTTVNGSGVSLYHKIKSFGFTMIDSFTKNRPMSFFMQKGKPNTIIQNIGADTTIKLYAEYDFKSTLYEGEVLSTNIGPAQTWSHFYKKGITKDPGIGDTVTVTVIGIDKNKNETPIATIVGSDTTLSFINATEYPNIRLKMNSKDNIYGTSEHLKYWRVHYQPVPEAALSPNKYFTFKDTLEQGEPIQMKLAIENLTLLPMDSMLVKFEVIDKNKNRTLVAKHRYKPLLPLDTIQVALNINSIQYPGNNVLYIEANPDKDQPEQFHPNNIGLKEFYVKPDYKNPLVDVTFDGVHILDGDIVSAKPNILISLRDNNKYLALDDTSLMSVFIKYPGENAGEKHYVPFDNKILKFIPASGDIKNNNTAKLEYRPEFTQNGKDYILTVKGKDKSGNFTGNNDYSVRFEVDNRPAISSLLNYPNPFTTSTQFIFTITGSQIPSNLKIQILSPTGKVVREITKQELGNIHIGRNISEYRWKGDDQYGQPLANGVYLYRFVTNLNGQKMEHYDTGADKWIEKGFGKLYIMR